MRRIRIVIAGVVAAAVAGCSSAAPSTPAAGGDAAAVEAAFRGHNQALLARDFATACSLNSPETNQQLIQQASAGGGQVSNCEDALKKLYASPRGAAISDGIGRNAQIQDVQLHGDTATVTWSVQAQGRQSTTRTEMRRIDGQWRLVAAGAP